MDLSESTVRDRAREYAEREPLYDVERQHVETVPRAFAGDEYGRRDAQWIVRWYFRRYLGEYPDRERREREEAFRDNAFDDVVDAIDAAVETAGATESDPTDGDADAALAALTALDGVDAWTLYRALWRSFEDLPEEST
ncbi:MULTISPECIES: hypothetical protein [Halorubrum]|uniref:Uncharacterized protein n=1 Tax=Halorubrum hochstenium ATCC 700873 TaxID=1227481 RepID=M0FBK6_9EURY|nr:MULTISPECIES: hypothetical protein [Halorubrum]ELZ56728.1 hypothetical protein C467_07642 [Halorubrum hochstenium ATCC 700873]